MKSRRGEGAERIASLESKGREVVSASPMSSSQSETHGTGRQVVVKLVNYDSYNEKLQHKNYNFNPNIETNAGRDPYVGDV